MTIRTPNRQSERGFTLAEILIVVTIIAVLAGSSIYLLTGLVDDAKYDRVGQDIGAIKIALDAYERNNYFKPPTEEQGLKALVEKPADPPPKWRKYLEEAPLDPWGNPYQYRNPGQRSGTKYDLFSMNENGVEDEDDIGNWK